MNSSEAYPEIVFVVSRFPYPLEKGDKLRSYYQIRELSKSYRIHLIALSDKQVHSEWKKELEIHCSSVRIYTLPKLGILICTLAAFLGNKPLQTGYFYNPFVARKIKRDLARIKPVHILSQLIRTTEYTKNYHYCPKTLDYMDALSKGIERRIDKAPWYTRWIFRLESRRLRNYERTVFDYFDHKTIISEQDRKYIFHPDRQSIVCVPNGIDQRFFEFQADKVPLYELGFVGNMSYPPNIDAIHFIREQILPQLPDARLLVAGATPHTSILRLAQHEPRLVVSGWVDDIRTAYASVRIFFAPMHIGTGMQNKLLEAMALGIPCVTTELANNAIGAVHNESIVVANSPVEMITAIQDLLSDPARCAQIGSAGRNFVQAHYSWSKATLPLSDAIKATLKQQETGFQD